MNVIPICPKCSTKRLSEYQSKNPNEHYRFGDLVKIGLRTGLKTPSMEWVWVSIRKETRRNEYEATIENDPMFAKRFKYNQLIRFKKNRIVQFYSNKS